MREVLTTACPLDCPDGCSLAVTIDDGRIVAVDADTSDAASPFTQGFICQKVKHHAKRVYAPERVLTPLIRSGPKGSGQFRVASWAEADAVIARHVRDAIDQHGANSVVPYLYTSSGGVLASSGLTPMLFERLGCPDVAHTICASTVGAAWQQVFGSMLGADPFDLQHSQTIVVWGANPMASNTHLLPLLTAATKRGARLVVIDPRQTGIAKRADLHLAIRPGTDVVLAYAVARWLRERGRLATDFVATHTSGSELFLAEAEFWTVDRAAEVCDVSAVDIETFAALIAEPVPAMLRLGYGLERNRNGGAGCVGALAVWLLCGHFGRLGSGVIGSTSRGSALSAERLWPQGVERVARATLSMNDVALALNGELAGWPTTRVLVVQGANPVATAMDQGSVLRGLANDDLFTVVHEQVMTDTALFADVVLPATTHFEVTDLANSYGSYSLQRIRPVIDRVGESRSNDEMAAGLARALGFAADEFDPDPERLVTLISGQPDSAECMSRAPGTTVQFVDSMPAHADGSQRARLADATSEMPVPRFTAMHADGLVLLTPATNRTINSMFAEFAPPDVVVCINVADAASRGVVDGGRVRVFNSLGELRLEARVDPAMRPGVAMIPKGLWCRHFENGLTANVLIPRGINDLGNGACFNDAIVEIEVISE